ncbi:DUF6894 family protein [Sphingopyxis sp.]|uniref:DUF6894 family protein n=1 Tax=Sphingopyxis sp. TaxID=1908224 RepID=UPI002D7937E8|nr:hypothetical protein [Sphingopyxis sp.]HET6526862.1 hypothetical protein [Sphingopyxis sp.]
MPRYFFHTRDGKRDLDDDGMELPDAGAARREAVRFGGSLLNDDPDMLSNDHGLRVEAVDEDGALCFAVIILAVDAKG